MPYKLTDVMNSADLIFDIPSSMGYIKGRQLRPAGRDHRALTCCRRADQPRSGVKGYGPQLVPACWRRGHALRHCLEDSARTSRRLATEPVRLQLQARATPSGNTPTQFQAIHGCKDRQVGPGGGPQARSRLNLHKFGPCAAWQTGLFIAHANRGDNME